MTTESETNVVDRTVRSRFAAIMGVPAENLQMDANLSDVYGLDSIRALKLISEVEVEFDIDIEQEEARGICTLDDVVAVVRAKLA